MNYYSEERIKKVLTWRTISVLITLIATWIYTGSIKEASFFTMSLHATLMTAHYLFELYWERRDQ